MNILEKIVAVRRRDFRLYDFPPRAAPLVPFFSPENKQPFVITEFKRSSPTRRKISVCAHAQLARDYYAAGMRNFSVLTEQNFFGGSLQDLYELKQKYPRCAFLRKDFLFCREDIAQAYQAGADAVLLIAEILPDKLLQELIAAAHEYKLQVLCEAYSLPSLQRILKLKHLPDAIGLNSRDLKTFKIQPDQPLRLKACIPPHIPAVYESGVDNEYLLRLIGNAGFAAALIGEAVVKNPRRVKVLRSFQRALAQGSRQKPNYFTKLYARQKKILVKICGLTSRADAEAALQAGADVLGFVLFAGSPRCVAPGFLREIKDLPALKVAVVHDPPDVRALRRMLRRGWIDAVQFHGAESAELVYSFQGNAYKAVTDPGQKFLPVTLYDAPKTKAMRKGRQISAQNYKQIYGQWLAGGLTPQNVRSIIRQARPVLVDVSSGVEKSAGVKDTKKIKAFLRAVT
jgi:indole-3-glycerol phosphate synthase/phosphoribosylanthranilate isomerase